MILIIHGDDIAASRNYYKQLQTKDTIVFDGEKVSNEDLQQALQTTGLFEEKKHIAIEQFFSKRKNSKEMDLLIESIDTHSNKTDIIFWETKLLTPKALNTFQGATDKSFAFPKSLFLFLEAVKPNNTKKLLSLYHDALQTTDADMILFMLIRQVRILLACIDPSQKSTIDEVKRMAPWQQKKIEAQTNQFSLEQLIRMHATLFEIEVKSKSGGLALPLSQTIDFFLLSL